MRLFLTLGSLAFLALVAGCTNTRWGFLNREKDQPVQGPPPSKEELVAYLNENAGRLHTFRSDDLHITLHQGLMPIGLSGNLMTQKPSNFRMSGNLLSSRMVDLGSNDQEFWWWISKDKPPDQYYCSYKDFKEGRPQSLPFPFQPEWIMEAMGMGPYGPAEKYELEHDAFTLKLVERTRSPQGRAVRKVIVMKRAPQAKPNPQVVAYLLLDDASGKELCSAHITEVDVKQGAVVPRRLELRWPAAEARLDMRLDGIAVNAQLPSTAFVRQPMPGVRSVDLARMFENSSVQRVQGIMNP